MLGIGLDYQAGLDQKARELLERLHQPVGDSSLQSARNALTGVPNNKKFAWPARTFEELKQMIDFVVATERPRKIFEICRDWNSLTQARQWHEREENQANSEMSRAIDGFARLEDL